jgi:hypothetical protein
MENGVYLKFRAAFPKTEVLGRPHFKEVSLKDIFYGGLL